MRERDRELHKGELMYVWSNAHVKWGTGCFKRSVRGWRWGWVCSEVIKLFHQPPERAVLREGVVNEKSVKERRSRLQFFRLA